MKIRCKGFTLIELLVSMLVVAIAMLGFAALQTFSSRSLSSTASKQSSSDALNAYVRFIESSRASIDTFSWAGGNQVILTCENINGNALFGSGATAKVPAKAFEGTFNTLCDQYIRNRSDINRTRNNIPQIAFAVRLTRNLNVGGINGLTTYDAEVALVYQPIPEGRTAAAMVAQNDVRDTVVSQEEHCPFGNLDADALAALQNLRANNNIVCNNVGLSL